jgi:hypothetical protein
MGSSKYELTDSVAWFDEGAVLDVTARFGDWHTWDLKLERSRPSPRSTIVVVPGGSGFSEAEILDETARIGHWEEYDLTFDPAVPEPPAATGRVEFTRDEFDGSPNPSPRQPEGGPDGGRRGPGPRTDPATRLYPGRPLPP